MHLATDNLVDDVLAAAVSVLEEQNIPVTPDTRYTILYTWSELFSGRQDDQAFEITTAINLAMTQLAPSLSTPIEF